MSCERYRHALTDHAFGAALDDRAARHLAACDLCRTWLASERRVAADLDDALRSEVRVSAAPGFRARVCARARDLPRARHAASARWLAAAAAVTLALGAYVALGVDRDPAAAPGGRISNSTPVIVQRPPPQVPLGAANGESGVPAAALADQSPDGHVQTAAHRPAPVPAFRRTTAARPRATPPLEVVVPPTQRQAIARFQELVRSGVLRDLERLAGDPLAAPPADLEIAPLSVPEIVIPDVAVVTGAGPLGGSTDSKEPL